MNLVIAVDEALRSCDAEAVIDNLGILVVSDRHAEDHIESKLLCLGGDNIGGRSWHGLCEAVLHLLLAWHILLIVVVGQCHLWHYQDICALLRGCLRVAKDAVQIALFLALGSTCPRVAGARAAGTCCRKTTQPLFLAAYDPMRVSSRRRRRN